MPAGAAVTGHLQGDWGPSVGVQPAQGRWQEAQLHGVRQPAHPRFHEPVVNI